ncbi:MAG TPA: sigma-70 family RNA polymerase sigma factor [Blastocatellia bacterium]|nr:sigma-70 family RNA polymerase sigma factor [Blastocatellia bacterium]
MIFGRNASKEEFESAALPHLNDLYRTAARVIGNSTEAEDLVQEAYLQAWKSFHRFELGTNCRAWLFKILFHVIQHHRRKWYNSKLVQESDDMLLQDTIPYEPPAPQHLSDEDVLAALERIPVLYREAVVLADVQEFSYKEVAATLSVPVGTVMSRLSRGRKLLRAELSGIAGSYGIREKGKSA